MSYTPPNPPSYNPVPPAYNGQVSGVAGQPVALAVSAFVCGLLAFLSGFFFIALLPGAAAIILGIVALRRGQSSGFSITGIVLGAIGFLTAAASTAFWIFAVFASASV